MDKSVTLTQLSYALALDKHRNFAKAAENCFVAQPTLSLQLKKLEQSIGFDLFDRSRSPITPTHRGERFLQQAQVILNEVEQLGALFEEDKKEPEGELRMGVIPTIACYIIPQLLPLLRKRHPKLSVRFFELPTREIVAQLEADKLDIGLVATPLELRTLNEHPQYYEPFVVYLSPDIRLRKQSLEVEDLIKYPLILLGDEHCFRGQTLKICSHTTRGQLECGSLDTITKLVDNGMGITLLPELAESGARERRVPFKPPAPCREVSIVTRKRFYKHRLLRALEEALSELVPKTYRTRKGRRVIGVDSF